MANLTKVVVSLDDGTTQEFDIAPVVASTEPTEAAVQGAVDAAVEGEFTPPAESTNG